MGGLIMSNENLVKRKALAEELFLCGEVVFKTRQHTVFAQESTDGFDYTLYKLGTKPDGNGEFDDSKSIDGGIIEDGDSFDAINYIFEVSEELQ
jgi:hypothetical protein